ncbi:hypothetical protein LX36DRAFT_184123 [Colletotrichum falcatum]|nr:hypothetical protein LX36DRAFT_184123 [Colletotrichum falcatum]
MVGHIWAYRYAAVIWGTLIWGTQLITLHSHICVNMHIRGITIGRAPRFGVVAPYLCFPSLLLSPRRSVVASYRAPWGAGSRRMGLVSPSLLLTPRLCSPPWRTFLKDSFSRVHSSPRPSLFFFLLSLTTLPLRFSWFLPLHTYRLVFDHV